MMSVVGPEVAGLGLLTSGLIILLLLSILLTALCSDCNRRSFELRDPDVEKNPSALIRVVKLEETAMARENPMIHEIQNDEREFISDDDNSAWITPWRSHLGALQSHSLSDEQTNGSAAVTQTGSVTTDTELHHEGENSQALFTPWRRHLETPQSHDVNGVNHKEAPPLSHTHKFSTDSARLYHTAGDSPSGGDAVVSPNNSEPSQQQGEEPKENETSGNPMYARVSKTVKSPTPPPFPSPSEEAEKEAAETSPPLPERKAVEE